MSHQLISLHMSHTFHLPSLVYSINILTCKGCDYRRGLDLLMDLLTSCIHILELQVITTLLQISTLYKSLAHGKSSQGVKLPEREADHSSPASAEVKKVWFYTSTAPYAFMA
jgi:hypothetical protein